MTTPRLLPAPTKKHWSFQFSPRLPQLPLPPSLALPNQKLLWTFLIVFLSLNIVLLANSQPPPWASLIPVYAQPFAATPHRNLAQAFHEQALPDGVKRELAIVADLVNAPVLGATTNTQEKAALSEHIVYWQNILTTKPDYRDGYLALALLLYQQGDLQGALAAAETAQRIDPVSTVALHLVELLRARP